MDLADDFVTPVNSDQVLSDVDLPPQLVSDDKRRLAGSLHIECCARSHMGSLYSVSELRGSIYVIGLYNRTFFMLYIY